MGNSLIEDSKVYCYHWGGHIGRGIMGCVGELMGNSIIEDSKVYCYNRRVIRGWELWNVWESLWVTLL